MTLNYGTLLIVALTISPFAKSATRKNWVDVTPIEDTIIPETTPHVVTEHYFTDEEVAELFLKLINERLSHVIDEARYKWNHGIEVIEKKERFDEILQNAEKQCKSFDLSPKDGVEFMMDQIEAGSVVQYSLISNWYAKENVDNSVYEMANIEEIPKESLDTLDISQIHAKMDEIQNDILFNLSKLHFLRTERDCGKVMGNAVYEIKESKNALIRTGLEMSLVNFCKVVQGHGSPLDKKPKRNTPVVRRRYWRNPKIYTPPPHHETTEMYTSIPGHETTEMPKSDSDSSDRVSALKTLDDVDIPMMNTEKPYVNPKRPQKYKKKNQKIKQKPKAKRKQKNKRRKS